MDFIYDKKIKKFEYNISKVEWSHKDNLKKHLIKHVIKGDDIERNVFVDCSNKTETNKQRINDKDIPDFFIEKDYQNNKYLDVLCRYEKISKETMKNSDHLFLSNSTDNKRRIVFIGRDKQEGFLTVSDKYEEKIISSYPSYLSDLFYVVPNLYECLCKEDRKLQINNCRKDTVEGLKELFNNLDTRSYELSRICLNNYVCDDIKIGSLVYSFVCSENNRNNKKGFNNLKRNVEKEIKKSNDNLIREDPLKAFEIFVSKTPALSKLDSLSEVVQRNSSEDKHRLYKILKYVQFNKDLYAEKIANIYIKLKNPRSFMEDSKIYGIKVKELWSLFGGDINNCNNRLTEISFITCWLDIMFTEYEKTYKHVLDNIEKDDIVTDFVIINEFASMYEGLFVLKNFNPQNNNKKYIVSIVYEYYKKRFIELFNNLNIHMSNRKILNDWYIMFEYLFDINIKNLD